MRLWILFYLIGCIFPCLGFAAKSREPFVRFWKATSESEFPEGTVRGEVDGEVIFDLESPNLHMPDPDLGYKVIPSEKIFHGRRTLERSIYDVTYTTDMFSRRHSQPSGESGSEFVIFHGGSFVFGTGLQNNESLPWQYGLLDKGKAIYNYSICASGPHMMLAQLRQGKMPHQVSQKKGMMIYVYLDFHIQRANGFIKEVLGDRGKTPFFQMTEQGDLKRNGNFETAKPWKTALFRFFGKDTFVP